MIRRIFYVILFAVFFIGVTGQYENCTSPEFNDINDGGCDGQNNNAECGYDGGDCCYCSCENDHLYPCGIWGYSCVDPDAADSSCASETASVDPCSLDTIQPWFVNDTASATSLAESTNCSGGTFDIKWEGTVLIDQTIYIPDGTTVYVTGEGSEAEINGGGKIRLFTVEGGVLHVDGLILRDGSATYGGAIAATRSNIFLNHTTCSDNIALSYGGAVYAGKSSTVACEGQMTFSDNYGSRAGGAVALSTSSSASWSGPTELSNNEATGDGGFGGAIYVNEDSRVSWNGVTSFSNNNASLFGGAMFVHDFSTTSWDGITCFANNIADQGGAVYVDYDSIISWTADTSFVNNTASSNGGAVVVKEEANASWDGVTYFVENTADYGGGIFVDTNSGVSWTANTSFNNNSAIFNGGALFVDENSTAVWDGMTPFIDNFAEIGGAIFVDENSSVSWTAETIFTNNTAIVGGGALYVDQYSIATWDGLTSFVANSAGFGGAVFIGDVSNVSWTAETSYINNTARSHGGAMLVHKGSIASWNGKTFFVKNSAGSGGMVSVSGNFANVSLTAETSFINNTASSNGGALFIELNSTAFWNGITSFTANAANSGGAIFVDTYSNVSWSGETSYEVNIAISYGGAFYLNEKSMASWDGMTSFIANTAGYGGAVSVNDKSTVWWTAESSFVNNGAMVGDGGALRVRFESTASWTGETSFTGNSANSSGGAAYVSTGANITVGGDTNFLDNYATVDGGAVFVYVGYDQAVLSYVFVDEEAIVIIRGNNCGANGGGIAFIGAVVTSLSPSMTFSRNSAGVAGGAVYMSGVSFGPQFNGSKFYSNSAVVGGGVYATGSGTAAVGDEDEDLQQNPTVFIGCEFNRNEATTTGGALNTGAGIDKIVSTSFVGNTAAIGGALRLVGAVSLEGCQFIDNLSDEDEGPGIFNDGIISGVSNCSFVSNVFNCDSGFYLAYNEVSPIFDDPQGRPIDCLYRAPQFFLVPFGAPNHYFEIDRLVVGNALWLYANAHLLPVLLCDAICQSEDALFDTICKGCGIQCEACAVEGKEPICLEELDHSSAAGGNTTIESVSIDPGYWRATNTSIEILACYNAEACVGGVTGDEGYCLEGYQGPYCSICIEEYAASLGFACTECSGKIVASVAVAVVAIAIFLAIIVFLSYMLSGKSEDADKGILVRVTRFIPLQSVKIVIVVWQILTQFSTVANVVFPSVYQDFLDSVDILNFDLTWVVSVGCIVETDFHDQLFFATLGPLVSMAFLGCTYVIAMRRSNISEDARRIVRRKHVSMVLLLTFLIYSPVSSTLFKMFACDDLDDDKIYLRVDYQIECDAPKHNALEIYTGFMVVLYVVGIPAFYGVLLYNNRESLSKNVGREEDDGIKSITDLWQPYRPGRFYYEVIECVRRVLLTGAIVFIYPNTAAQIAIELMMVTFFMIVSEALDPYESQWDTWCNRAGNAIVFTSIFLALLLKVDVSNERASSQEVFEWVLVAAHSCLILIVVVEAVATVLAWKAETVDEDIQPRIRPYASVSSSNVGRYEGFLVEEDTPRRQ